MGFMDKVKDFVAPIEEDNDYQEAPQAEKVEEVEPQSRYERPKNSYERNFFEFKYKNGIV